MFGWVKSGSFVCNLVSDQIKIMLLRYKTKSCDICAQCTILGKSDVLYFKSKVKIPCSYDLYEIKISGRLAEWILLHEIRIHPKDRTYAFTIKYVLNNKYVSEDSLHIWGIFSWCSGPLFHKSRTDTFQFTSQIQIRKSHTHI